LTPVSAPFTISVCSLEENTKSLTYQSFSTSDLPTHKPRKFPVSRPHPPTVSSIKWCLFYCIFQMLIGNWWLEWQVRIFIMDFRPYPRQLRPILFRPNMTLNIFCFPEQPVLLAILLYASPFGKRLS
jgi:hypothetical protein